MNFTDLRDSTLKDFVKYTGLHVPQGTKEVTIPGTRSVILFRHGDDLEGLQNINLGWVYMEQAEEFPDAAQFDMLRGRLRRELEVDESFKASHEAYDDYIEELKRNPLRQLMVGANAAGHCWTWKKWVKDRQEYMVTPDDPEIPEQMRGKRFKAYELHEATSYDNYSNLPEDFILDIASMKADSPSKYRRLVLNSHDDYECEGSYWASEISKLRRVSPPQIAYVPHDPSYTVHTAWDVGYTTCFWAFQLVGVNVYFLAYYEAQGEPVVHFTDLLAKWRVDRGYRYGTHLGPWDISSNAHKVTEGRTFQQIAAEHGIFFRKMPQEKDVNNSIETVKSHISRFWFDAQGCEAGLEALEWFHVKKNARMSTVERPYYIDMPQKDWSEPCAKAFILADQGIPLINNVRSGATIEQIKKWQRKYGLVS